MDITQQSQIRDPQLEEQAGEHMLELSRRLDLTIYCMASLAEARDRSTVNHVRRIQNYVRILADKLQCNPKFSPSLSAEAIELLYRAAPLHDIGKIAIPERILLKQGPLNRSEWEEMKRHTIYGRDALVRTEQEFGPEPFLEIARDIAYTHHERWDGQGYPEGLVGEEIPIAGRLMALADVYDALISQRVYKSAYPHNEAVEKIRKERGTHFDPEVVDAFVDKESAFFEVASRFGDEYTSV